jgi:hypothetical protein
LITAGTKTAYTDAQGMFVIKNTNVKEKLAYVKAEKSGYFPGSRSLIPTQTSSNYVKIQMMTLNVAGTIPAGVPATVTTNGGASIDFKGQYVDQNGNPYTGSVTVAAKYLPALAPETSEQMPGMLYAENTDGEAGALVSYGMIVVELYGNTGQSLNIAQGSSAILHMPVDDQQAGSAPATIPLWFFDEVAGYWIEEGSATLVDGEYVGEVTHFTFWNCDVFYDDCQLNGLVTDNLGNPLGSATVEINLGYTSTTGLTNSDGTFFTYVPAGQNIDINVSYGCGGVTPYAVGPYTSNSVNNETFISQLGTSILNLAGTLVNCDLQPVTNADVYFYDGLNYLTYHVDNGIIDINVPYCSGATTADIYIYDYNQPYSYFSNTSIALTYPSTDLAQVVICDSVSTGGGWSGGLDCDSLEYFEVSIDGSFVLADACVSFSYYDSVSTGFVIYPTVDQNYFIYSPDVNAPGTYPGTTVVAPNTGEVVFVNGYDMSFSLPVNFSTQILTYEGPGGYIELMLTGTYTDNASIVRNVVANVTAYIPN